MGVKRAVADLNGLHSRTPALHARDCEPDGFRWIVVDDVDQSVAAWLRFGAPGDAPVAVVCNFTPVPRIDYRIGLPAEGRWLEVFNSDAEVYGGSGMGNLGAVTAQGHSAHGLPASAEITLPPLAAVYFRYDPG
jgi:1,4-alpha-glucan branching enzyme